jgi:hypothetical protein
MKKAIQSQSRLPITFHRTFIPEMHYVAALLQFAASGDEGTEQEISATTGIPTGKSDGKVPAIIGYASGMGLINAGPSGRPGKKKLDLTDFGRSVLLEDSQIGESLTQWLAHLNLCRRAGGAEVWHLTFAKSQSVLGMEFSLEELEEYLIRKCGKRNRSLIGPLLRTYQEPTSLSAVSAIKEEAGRIKRFPAPILDGFSKGYAAFFLSIWETHFLNETQVTLSDFEETTYWQRICGWDLRQREVILAMFEGVGAINIDKRMRPWVVMRKNESRHYWSNCYEDLI